MEESENLQYAYLADHAERYEDVVKYMREYITVFLLVYLV